MKKLSLSDRELVENRLREVNQDSFYHYFPLILAISETNDEPLYVDSKGNLWVGKEAKELYFEGSEDALERAYRVWISQNLPPRNWGYASLYDVNYVYDLKTTLNLENFRDNVKRFEKSNSNVCVKSFENSFVRDALKVLEEWYSKRKERKTFSDFGYTTYLVSRFSDFYDELRGIIAYRRDVPVGISLWSDSRPVIGIGLVSNHLVCKTRDLPFLHDFLRYETYCRMRDEGVDCVNDGSDLGLEGLRTYKLKLRPRLIFPIWSWNRM